MNANQECVTITLGVGEEKTLFETLKITYVSYSHEHASSGPDDAFSATVGVYCFELTENDTTTMITVYKDVDNNSKEMVWLRYTLVLLDSANQEVVTLAITRV